MAVQNGQSQAVTDVMCSALYFLVCISFARNSACLWLELNVVCSLCWVFVSAHFLPFGSE